MGMKIKKSIDISLQLVWQTHGKFWEILTDVKMISWKQWCHQQKIQLDTQELHLIIKNPSLCASSMTERMPVFFPLQFLQWNHFMFWHCSCKQMTALTKDPVGRKPLEGFESPLLLLRLCLETLLNFRGVEPSTLLNFHLSTA